MTHSSKSASVASALSSRSQHCEEQDNQTSLPAPVGLYLPNNMDDIALQQEYDAELARYSIPNDPHGILLVAPADYNKERNEKTCMLTIQERKLRLILTQNRELRVQKDPLLLPRMFLQQQHPLTSLIHLLSLLIIPSIKHLRRRWVRYCKN